MEEKYRAFFQEADKDGSGYLDFGELSSILRSHGYSGTDEELKAMFSAVDMSGDQKVSMDEYLSAMGAAPPNLHRGAAARKVFMEFDKDGSGSIDAKELQAVMGEMGQVLTDEEAKRLTELCDADGSGTIDYNEFMKSAFGK